MFLNTIKISNDTLEVKIKSNGAELCSIKDLTDDTEHLWQADPAVWAWHAPLLFPIVGVSENDELRIDGKKYIMPKHGFARRTEFTILRQEKTSVEFLLSSSPDSLKIYPYQFDLWVKYKIINNELQISYEVKNKDDKTMYYSIGGHPALSIAYREGETIADYFIEFEELETIDRYRINKESGLFNGDQTTLLTNENIIPISHDLFKNDALILKELKSRTVYLKSRRHDKFVQVDFGDFDYLGIWAIPGAKYVCIEPWLGCADTEGQLIDIQQKEGIIALLPAQSRKSSYAIKIF